MSQDLQSQDLTVSHEKRPELPPAASHGGVRFEETDTNARAIVISLVIIGAMLLVTLAVTIMVQQYLRITNPRGDLPSPLSPARIIPPGPLLDVHPAETYPLVRQHEDEVLNGYGSDGKGHLHVPISRAMDAIVSKLPIRPDAPVGTTTPGGLDRRFSGSLQQAPGSHHGVEIQGEIQKHAQP